MANKHKTQDTEVRFSNSKQTGYAQSLDNGVLGKPGEGHRLGSCTDYVAAGENPNGLLVQTPNGTSRQCHKQQKTVYNVNTDRWTGNEDWHGDLSGN